jgi:hypothetical protein
MRLINGSGKRADRKGTAAQCGDRREAHQLNLRQARAAGWSEMAASGARQGSAVIWVGLASQQREAHSGRSRT